MKIFKKRGVYVPFVGLLIYLVFEVVFWISGGVLPGPWLREILELGLTTIITITIWEGNLIIEKILSKHWPWSKSPGRRIFWLVITNFVLTVSVVKISSYGFEAICEYYGTWDPLLEQMVILIALLITFLVITIKVSNWFFKQWKNSLIEVEKFKKNHLEAQYENLRNQVNPHFLFNSLSVLSTLVYKDQKRATGFIDQLSKVYRYVLDQRNIELVSLKEELEFLDSYIYLLKTRFNENLIFKINIPIAEHNKMILPMSTQILIENCIKHNTITRESPLTVELIVSDDYLVIKNKIQKRAWESQGAGIGLENITKRYAYFTDKKVEIQNFDNHFMVWLPLLELSD